jgi:hypothetical protein
VSISDWLQRLWKKEAQHYVYASIPPQRQDSPLQEVTLQAEQHYLRLWLSESFLADDRRLFREYVPVVHSAVRLQFASNPAQELPYIAGPQNVGLGTTLGKGVQLNHPLTNLLPFKGGTVSLSTALLAYKQKDFFQGFVEVLHDVSGLLNVGQLSSTLKIVEGAVDGIQNLLGAGDKDVHLIYFQSFGGATSTGGVSLKSGYTAVIRAAANRFNKNKLFVKDSQLHYGNDLASSRPLEGYDYMLLRTEASQTRDDFLGFEDFAKLLTQAIQEGTKDRAAGDQIIQAAQIAVWSAPDFTNTDRVRVAKALKQEYVTAIGGGTEEARRGLTERMEIFSARVVEIAPEDAQKAAASLVQNGELSLSRFLDEVR